VRVPGGSGTPSTEGNACERESKRAFHREPGHAILRRVTRLAEVTTPLVGVIMGSKSDWESTMRHAHLTLEDFGVPHECRVVSAHRTPDAMVEYGRAAMARGLRVVIAGAGGAAHLPGMIASETLLPVVGVPVQSQALSGLDSLLSINQMPAGVPVGTMAIGKAGAINAALYAMSILALTWPELVTALGDYRKSRAEAVRSEQLP
jgi:5-(carboxyamino)imidazole ribonucleotide mutase